MITMPIVTACLYIHILFGICGPNPFAGIGFPDSIEESTFAQMEWDQGGSCNLVVAERGCSPPEGEPGE